MAFSAQYQPQDWSSLPRFDSCYDTVWHTGLLNKLTKCMEPRFVNLRPIDLFLINRRFRVLHCQFLVYRPIRANGLPEGSVLAPTLFNLYTNDLPVTLYRKFMPMTSVVLSKESFC